MRRVAVVLNVVFVVFTLFVIATDGPAAEPAYAVFIWLLLLIPLLTVFTLLRPGIVKASRIAALLNILLLGAICWALFDQYPHPSEPGFIEYVALALGTPILSAVSLFHGGRTDGRWRPEMKIT